MNCLTIDVEEHFQISAFDSVERRNMWDRLESRVERNTERLLELLAERRTRATFFVLGWVAERPWSPRSPVWLTWPGPRVAGPDGEVARVAVAGPLTSALSCPSLSRS